MYREFARDRTEQIPDRRQFISRALSSRTGRSFDPATLTVSETRGALRNERWQVFREAEAEHERVSSVLSQIVPHGSQLLMSRPGWRWVLEDNGETWRQVRESSLSRRGAIRGRRGRGGN